MLQRKFLNVLLAAAYLAATGCDGAGSAGETRPVHPIASAQRIVSLSPAATDLLLAMGAADRLTGVSTYDNDPRVAGVPRVGDYENVDWERIASLAPKRMIVQMAADRIPPGFRERAAKLGISLHVSQIDRLDDVMRQIIALGAFAGITDDSKTLRRAIEAQLGEAKQRAEGLPRVRTLIITSSDGKGVAGRDTYLDDLLSIAGGENVVEAIGYSELDREALLKLMPDVIVQLAPSPRAGEREAIARHWSTLQSLPAVKNGKVLIVEEPWALMPGAHVGELAMRMADFLHHQSP